MAVSCDVSCVLRTSSSQNFDDGVCYALSQLGLSDLKPKNEQEEAIHAVYDGRTSLFANWLWQKCLLSDTMFPLDHKRGLVSGKKRSCAIIISPLVALMVHCRSGQESEVKWCQGCDHLLWLKREQRCGQKIPCY